MEKIKLYLLNNKKWVVLCLLVFIVMMGFIGIYYSYYGDNEKSLMIDDSPLENTDITIKEPNPKKEDNKIIEYIYVDIKGLVNKPGVYKFSKEENYRVNDLIKAAGGVKKDADTSVINMSLRLVDEMVVVIYSKKEISDFVKTKQELRDKLAICDDKEVINDACIKDDNVKDEPKDEIKEKININTASKEALMSLSNIGEAKALAIIQYREEVGLFVKIEDIKNVSGIGDSLFEQIKDNITVE